LLVIKEEETGIFSLIGPGTAVIILARWVKAGGIAFE
jgi:hypothetical protein